MRSRGVGVVRSLLFGAVVFVTLCGGPAAAREGAGVPEPLLRKVESTTSRVAGKGQTAAVELLLDALSGLGRDEKAVERMRRKCERALSTTGKKPRPAPKEAAALRRFAAEIAEVLPTLSDAERPVVATAILDIDGSVEAAHAALGHARHGDGWVPRRLVPVLERRAKIREALQQAERLAFEFEEKPSELPAVLAVGGKPGRSLHWKAFSLHSPTIPIERLRRIFLRSLRAWTFANFLSSGKLVTPEPRRVQMVLLRSRAEYLVATRHALDNGGLDSSFENAALEHWGMYKDARGFHLSWNAFEPGHQATVLREMFWWQHQIVTHANSDEPLQPCLHKGHLNWLCWTFLGAAVPDWGTVDVREGPGSGRTSDTPGEAAERTLLVRLAEAGIAGMREYLVYLARRHEDPAFSSCIVDRSARLAGLELMKATLVVEYLHDTGEFQELLRKTARKPSVGGTFSAALGESLGEFEERWTEWLLAGDRPVSAVALLEAGETTGTKRPAVLDYLDALRAQTLVDPESVIEVAGTSAGCALHARYLVANPEQQSAWPDCHEQYADREGYSPRGAWAGANSVIHCGAQDGNGAIDGWMGTFYHRLPLLHPGLLGAGWAHEGGVAVLDVGSLVDHGWRSPVVVPWPAPGARKVPLRFNPEMPNPVPGEDQSTWGYPITLQFFGARETRPEVTLRLFEGAASGKEVACHVSTPDRPSNPFVAPRGAYCLMPKSHLKPRTKYTVVVEGLPEDAPKALRGGWSFTTGE